MKQAVCLLLVSKEGNFLGVSRRDNPSHWGMPGGKVDFGENVLDALQREVKEEIGVHILKINMIPLYAGSEGEFWVSTFIHMQEIPEDIEFTIESGLSVRWISPKEFLTLDPFRDYNEAVFRQFVFSDILDLMYASQPSN